MLQMSGSDAATESEDPYEYQCPRSKLAARKAVEVVIVRQTSSSHAPPAELSEKLPGFGNPPSSIVLPKLGASSALPNSSRHTVAVGERPVGVARSQPERAPHQRETRAEEDMRQDRQD